MARSLPGEDPALEALRSRVGGMGGRPGRGGLGESSSREVWIVVFEPRLLDFPELPEPAEEPSTGKASLPMEEERLGKASSPMSTMGSGSTDPP